VSGLRRLAAPRPVVVRTGRGGVPLALERTAVAAVAEDWVVEDAWWTASPLRRRYFELVLSNGANAVVFHDLVGGRWYTQRT